MEDMKNIPEDYPTVETWWRKEDTKTTLHLINTKTTLHLIYTKTTLHLQMQGSLTTLLQENGGKENT